MNQNETNECTNSFASQIPRSVGSEQRIGNHPVICPENSDKRSRGLQGFVHKKKKKFTEWESNRIHMPARMLLNTVKLGN